MLISVYTCIYDTTGLDSIADEDGDGDGDQSESKEDGSTNNDVDDSETDKAAVGMYRMLCSIYVAFVVHSMFSLLPYMMYNCIQV